MDRTHVKAMKPQMPGVREDSQQLPVAGEGLKVASESEKNRMRTEGPQAQVLSACRGLVTWAHADISSHLPKAPRDTEFKRSKRNKN